MMKAGLLAASFGAGLLALSSHLGVVTGFVGTALWATPGWRLLKGLGWLLLIGRFVLQYGDVRRASRAPRYAETVDAVVTALERKGVITKAEVLEEITRVQATTPKAHSRRHERRGHPDTHNEKQCSIVTNDCVASEPKWCERASASCP